MLQKSDALGKVSRAGVVAVVRGDSKEQAYKSAIACVEGGVRGIELTFTAPHADEVIADLVEKYQDNDEVLIGAGTVLDTSTARISILAGAQFIVSPSFSKDVAMLCNLYAIPYIPGCMTPSDIQQALSYGAEIVKVFPGSVVGQPMVSELQGPFPQANLMITGGVSLNNLEEWFAKGATVVGVGGKLVGPAAEGDYNQVTKNAIAYMTKVQELQKAYPAEVVG
ncbi:bifunctional 2-keto-4-hydroxyglutarate aldolase/2-keto-3-deoxy-6-phosphogluconate aldolase [Levilactobacillus namurensis]|uniref:bifunctional 2-keto-4-hydroxyglutarate aldolase/2-keto-3-deoxy-6-phosphogluconate aldolase n=1 Tax=Levilactobacillus namurensis TaxID=380393 RepID=UPI001D628BBD|nr:bifunctional 2-keto-4-hydroxyglutarate aldolase/2-keto-3-deoxy-6-phosphogluconate aldolase [Levilactobacillus namurensis]HJE44362.1 bifunctional 2-keto-4-hydroxyglutarate aldolase/2-keto-3-deoxy-6-phosphogluconate aldolase [Levilactobacillus namurensis]